MKNYVKTNWIDNVTPVNACNLNKIETALMKLAAGKLEAGDIIQGDGIKIDVINGKLVISITDYPDGGGSGEGGNTGTLNYNELYNKPSINGVMLQGNISSDSLGINSVSQEDFEKLQNIIELMPSLNLDMIETNEDGFFIVDEHYNIGVSISLDGTFTAGKLSDNLINQVRKEINIWE